MHVCMFIVNYVLLHFLMVSWCKVPEDGDNAETCRGVSSSKNKELHIYWCCQSLNKYILTHRTNNKKFF